MRYPLVVLAVLLFVAPRARAGDLPREKQRALRELLAAVVAEPDAAKRKALAAGATALAGDAPIADVVAAVRKGPLYADGAPKARKVSGRTEELTVVGNVVVGYSFEHAGVVYRYAVDVPNGYDAGKPVGLLLDPGHGTARGQPDKEKAGYLDMWRRFVDEAGHRDWLVARTEIIEQSGTDGVKELPEDDVGRAFDAFFRDLLSRFAVDVDRIVVTGLSQTGFWAWYLGAFRADRFAGIAPMSAVTFHVDRFAGNLVGLPTYVLHGDADPTCAVDQPRKMTARLARLGGVVEYREIAGAAHEISVWNHLPEGLKWLDGKPRVRYPKRVGKSVRNLSGPWASWIRIDGMEKQAPGEAHGAPAAGIDGEIEGQIVRLHGDRVTSATVFLAPEMLDLAAPVEVIWNGKSVHKGVVTPSAATLLEVAGDKCDWSATYVASVDVKP